LIHNPEKILGQYIFRGQTVMDIGCGLGLFSLSMARLVGEEGRVIAVDFQEKMLRVLEKRARKAGLMSRIFLHQSRRDGLHVTGTVDFALAFWMVHEVPDRKSLFSEIAGLLEPGGRFLLAEPKVHVGGQDFRRILGEASAEGLKPLERLPVRLSRAVLMARDQAV
jgi:ubiquinone/menaquinone biosynthesis C-methylase UbiE